MDAITSLAGRLAELPRLPLAPLPTPLERLDRLSADLGIDLWMKRDDQTGLAFGGNKTRKLEFVMADAREQGCDTIVTWAGLQSNWCRQTAAAACRLGMGCVLVLFRRQTQPDAVDGNLLLDHLLGADVRVVPAESVEKYMAYDDVSGVLDPIASELQAAGRVPYIAPIGGSVCEASMHLPWGAVGYVDAAIETVAQANEAGVDFDAVVFATGSGGTQAGLVVGWKALSPDTRVIGVSVSETKAEMEALVGPAAEATADLLELALTVEAGDVDVREEYLGEGYGVLDDDVREAVRYVARGEGILLDPVYTGKAMAGLTDLVARGDLPHGSRVLFWHTGGTPALFPYRDGLLD